MQRTDDVQAARRVPLPSLLPPDWVLHKKGPNKYMAMCTFHEETTPSMSLCQYQDGSWGYKCFGCGAKGDPINYVKARDGIDFFDAVKLLTSEARKAPMRRQPVAEYDYYDKDGVLVYQVLRYEPKDFRVRRPSEHGWQWCLDGLKRHLYRLPKLNMAENMDKPIYYVEGEKDVHTMEEHGLVATTHSGGANSFRPDLLDEIEGAGRRLVVIPDRDEPGMQLMRKVYGAARERKFQVGFLLLDSGRPDTDQWHPSKPCKDVTEYFQAGGTLEHLLELVK